MSFPRFAFVLLAASMCLGATAQAQKTSAPTVDNAFVEQEFGSNCKLVGMPSLRGDLDGDGVEDIVIPAHCNSPLMDQAQNNYLVIDPYDSFFGYGNPKVTTAFVADDPQRRGFSLLVIHGAGPDAWYAAVPKAKFMLVNIPFRDIKIRKLQVKKKPRMAIYVEETGGEAMTSMVFWDGKRYRYDPMGSSME
ncbi:MAG: hypothetical protein ACLPOO_15545 [Terriglobales bacterium]